MFPQLDHGTPAEECLDSVISSSFAAPMDSMDSMDSDLAQMTRSQLQDDWNDWDPWGQGPQDDDYVELTPGVNIKVLLQKRGKGF